MKLLIIFGFMSAVTAGLFDLMFEACKSDEMNCNNGNCISSEAWCDGVPDCSAGEDELNCPPQEGFETCESDQMKCNNGNCISSVAWCNGVPDCSEGEDEINCPPQEVRCSNDEFTCSKGHCIPLSKRCDGIPDCKDYNDELDCPTNTSTTTMLAPLPWREFILCSLVTNTSNLNSTVNCTEAKIKSLANISAQDIISAQMNVNDKITRRIESYLFEFAFRYDSYRSIELPIHTFSLPPSLKFMKVIFPNKTVLFHDVNISSDFDRYTKQTFTTIIGCDSSGVAKIQVSLPTNVQIKSNVIVKSLSQQGELINEGQFSYTLKNAVLLRQSKVKADESNLETDIKQQILAKGSSINLETNNHDHQFIYKKIDSFTTRFESSIGAYLLTQLNNEIVKRNITLVSTCLNFMKTKQANKKNSPSIDDASFFSTIYVIDAPWQNTAAVSLCIVQSIKSELDEMITLNPGAIVIEGLTDFTNFEITLSNSHYNNETLILQLKSGILTGKFTWLYSSMENENNNTLEFPFSIDYVKVEIELEQLINQYHDPIIKKLEIRVNLRGIYIHTSLPDIYCEQEGKFQRELLSAYLKTAIVDSLENSLTEKLNDLTKNPNFKI